MMVRAERFEGRSGNSGNAARLCNVASGEFLTHYEIKTPPITAIASCMQHAASHFQGTMKHRSIGSSARGFFFTTLAPSFSTSARGQPRPSFPRRSFPRRSFPRRPFLPTIVPTTIIPCQTIWAVAGFAHRNSRRNSPDRFVQARRCAPPSAAG